MWEKRKSNLTAARSRITLFAWLWRQKRVSKYVFEQCKLIYEFNIYHFCNIQHKHFDVIHSISREFVIPCLDNFHQHKFPFLFFRECWHCRCSCGFRSLIQRLTRRWTWMTINWCSDKFLAHQCKTTFINQQTLSEALYNWLTVLGKTANGLK